MLALTASPPETFVTGFILIFSRFSIFISSFVSFFAFSLATYLIFIGSKIFFSSVNDESRFCPMNWFTIPILPYLNSLICFSPSSAILISSTYIVPPLGFSSPERILISVLFPEPEGPMILATSPSFT